MASQESQQWSDVKVLELPALFRGSLIVNGKTSAAIRMQAGLKVIAVEKQQALEVVCGVDDDGVYARDAAATSPTPLFACNFHEMEHIAVFSSHNTLCMILKKEDASSIVYGFEFASSNDAQVFLKEGLNKKAMSEWEQRQRLKMEKKIQRKKNGSASPQRASPQRLRKESPAHPRSEGETDRQLLIRLSQAHVDLLLAALSSQPMTVITSAKALLKAIQEACDNVPARYSAALGPLKHDFSKIVEYVPQGMADPEQREHVLKQMANASNLLLEAVKAMLQQAAGGGGSASLRHHVNHAHTGRAKDPARPTPPLTFDTTSTASSSSSSVTAITTSAPSSTASQTNKPRGLPPPPNMDEVARRMSVSSTSSAFSRRISYTNKASNASSRESLSAQMPLELKSFDDLLEESLRVAHGLALKHSAAKDSEALSRIVEKKCKQWLRSAFPWISATAPHTIFAAGQHAEGDIIPTSPLAIFLLCYRRAFDPPAVLGHLMRMAMLPPVDSRTISSSRDELNVGQFKCNLIVAPPNSDVVDNTVYVLELLLHWVVAYWVDFDGNEEYIQALHRTIDDLQCNSSHSWLRDEVLAAVKYQMVNGLPAPVLHAQRQGAGPTPGIVMQIPPQTLAEQMSLFNYDLFKRVHSREYFEQALFPQHDLEVVAPNLQILSRRFEDEGQWVAAEILQHKTRKEQATMIAKFIRVAEECVKLHNYFSFFCIMGALSCREVSDMKRAWRTLPEKYKKVFASLEKLTDTSRNMKAYRDAWKNAGHTAKLPFLPLHLKDLLFAKEAWSSSGKPWEESIDSWQLIAKIVRELMMWHPYKMHCDYGLQSYLRVSVLRCEPQFDSPMSRRQSTLPVPPRSGRKARSSSWSSSPQREENAMSQQVPGLTQSFDETHASRKGSDGKHLHTAKTLSATNTPQQDLNATHRVAGDGSQTPDMLNMATFVSPTSLNLTARAETTAPGITTQSIDQFVSRQSVHRPVTPVRDAWSAPTDISPAVPSQTLASTDTLSEDTPNQVVASHGDEGEGTLLAHANNNFDMAHSDGSSHLVSASDREQPEPSELGTLNLGSPRRSHKFAQSVPFFVPSSPSLVALMQKANKTSPMRLSAQRRRQFALATLTSPAQPRRTRRRGKGLSTVLEETSPRASHNVSDVGGDMLVRETQDRLNVTSLSSNSASVLRHYQQQQQEQRDRSTEPNLRLNASPSSKQKPTGYSTEGLSVDASDDAIHIHSYTDVDCSFTALNTSPLSMDSNQSELISSPRRLSPREHEPVPAREPGGLSVESLQTSTLSRQALHEVESDDEGAGRSKLRRQRRRAASVDSPPDLLKAELEGNQLSTGSNDADLDCMCHESVGVAHRETQESQDDHNALLLSRQGLPPSMSHEEVIIQEQELPRWRRPHRPGNVQPSQSLNEAAFYYERGQGQAPERALLSLMTSPTREAQTLRSSILGMHYSTLSTTFRQSLFDTEDARGRSSYVFDSDSTQDDDGVLGTDSGEDENIADGSSPLDGHGMGHDQGTDITRPLTALSSASLATTKLRSRRRHSSDVPSQRHETGNSESGNARNGNPLSPRTRRRMRLADLVAEARTMAGYRSAPTSLSPVRTAGFLPTSSASTMTSLSTSAASVSRGTMTEFVMPDKDMCRPASTPPEATVLSRESTRNLVVRQAANLGTSGDETLHTREPLAFRRQEMNHGATSNKAVSESDTACSDTNRASPVFDDENVRDSATDVERSASALPPADGRDYSSAAFRRATTILSTRMARARSSPLKRESLSSSSLSRHPMSPRVRRGIVLQDSLQGGVDEGEEGAAEARDGEDEEDDDQNDAHCFDESLVEFGVTRVSVEGDLISYETVI
eukprot:m.189011 g.189011  ORF g.189011 m.189011 type:complete len:1848 (-) comp16736_c0_seq1:93-5636(-)